MTEDPTRLAALPSSAELTSLIQAARERMPDASALSRLRSGLQASLSVPLAAPPTEFPAPAPTPNANAASLTRAVPLSIALPALVVVLGGVLVGLHFSSSRSRVSRSPVPALATPRSSPRTAASEGPMTLAAEATSSAAPTPIALPSSSMPRARAAILAPAPSGELARPSEVDLVGQAGRILKLDPTRALALTDQHRKLYPSGALSEEREVIAIEALARLGDLEAAQARAEQFISSFPRSAHFPRVIAAAQLQTIDTGAQEKPSQRAPRE